MSARLALGLSLFFGLVVGSLLYANRPKEPTARVAGEVHETLVLGKDLYETNCAACHGQDGWGYAQTDVPAPALNGSEHAWHHPDEQILELIKRGGKLMPAVGANWTDKEIEAVWAYVKQWWTPEQRRLQAGEIGETF